MADSSSSLLREVREVLSQSNHFSPEFLESVFSAFASEIENVR
jgi:hypothetical protein